VRWTRNGKGAYTLAIPPAPGHYGVVSPPLQEWGGDGFPAVLSVDIEAQAGSIGVALISKDQTQLLSGERRLDATNGRITVPIYSGSNPNARLLLRNFGSADQAPAALVYGINMKNASTLKPGEIKRVRAGEFNYWYYSADLGDGVRVEAGLPGGPSPMPGHYKGRRILHWMLERYFGGVAGKTVLEPACSGGFHTVGLAKLGAKVTSFDLDAAGVRQAAFVAECQSEKFAHAPQFHHADFYEFMEKSAPVDIVYCSGLLYHLSDIPRAIKLLADRCKQGA
jgi:hypothetical protein